MLLRLDHHHAAAAHVPKKRKSTRPTFGSKVKRLDLKRRRGRVKALRGKSGLSDA